ncbi:DNA/RNA polymerase [Lojkania enalia]|uniref:DNA-directed RNA polymerase n=1 Tax=Lojkania enalia TaxID=147567 RepID=A0A9P4KJK6_9PLEO|nr:DNA/RNA polymerase [Didymosphaeria enalia]
MLTRAARRKLRRDAFRPPAQLAQQLTLPWLCPAQMRWAASAIPTTDSHSRDSRRRKLSSLSLRQETRSLATAADVQSSQDGSLPFDTISLPWGRQSSRPELSQLQRFDVTKPLIINDGVTTVMPTTQFKYGIGGDPTELHQNLYACLRVGRMDRAAAIIQRLTTVYNPSAPEIVDAHNVYLRTMFELAEQSPSETSVEDIEGWYKTEMVDKLIVPNAETFVTLIRTSMKFLKGSEKDKAIRKYLSMAYEDGPGLLEEINASPEFSDDEWDALIRLQPDQFDEPPLVEDVLKQFSTPVGQALAIQHGLLPDPSLSVRSIPQKGMGLHSLRAALAMFELGQDVPYPHDMEGTKEDKDRAYAYMRQIRLEEDSLKAATERWKAEDAKLQEMGIHGVLQSKPLQALMWNWYSTLLPCVVEELKAIKKVVSTPSAANRADDRHIYGPYIENADPEKLAAITVQRTICSVIKTYRSDVNGLKVPNLALSIGRAIEDEEYQSLKRRQEAYLRKQRSMTRIRLVSQLSKQKQESNAQPPSSLPQYIKSKHTQFPLNVKTKLGALYLDKLMQTAKITLTREDPKTGKQVSSTQPAFSLQLGFHAGKKISWVNPHPELFEKLQKESVHHVSTIRLPMLVEPKPWSSYDVGGFYTVREPVVRLKEADQEPTAYTNAAIENGDMDKLLAGLDVLGKLPWNINGDVFRVVLEAWNNGEGVGGLVPAQDDLEFPQEPPSDATFHERKLWLRKVKEWENTKGGLHSQRCYQNFQIEIARSYLNEKFYYPHSVDFRGRAYPVPPILNHIGADFSRGLLKFANGKELGTVGLKWLKVHLANLYGYDKASLGEREQFAMDNIKEIYDSATNPLRGNRWWSKAEDPWQCLACCIELKNALDSPDPTRFVSHLPVHQDGTCNGLQHYAALGGDEAGASQVNLEPSDRPQDIYTGVAEIVKEMVAEDAEAGNPMAKFLNGKITRKVVKRTVMTNVYGVTFMGAKDQVLTELKAIFPQFNSVPGVPTLGTASMYIALHIFRALGRIFNGAQEIQHWLGECADRITTSITSEQIRRIQDRYEGKPYDNEVKFKDTHPNGRKRAQKLLDQSIETFRTGVIWTTPLKMPIVQPYRKGSIKKVSTSVSNISVATRPTTVMVDKRKQLQAFPPNFIHSLDATHMILSALKCDEMGIDFAAVHDSFWTHAADIPNLNAILRDAFVRMHSEDIVGRLAAEFNARHAGSMYRAEIYATTPVGKKITQWRKLQRGPGKVKYKQGEASFTELAMEAKRQQLLRSEKEEERLEGKRMITPTSIYLAEKNTSALASHRLALLGETKEKNSPRKGEIRKDLLKAEAEVIEDDPSSVTTAAIKVPPVDAEHSHEAEEDGAIHEDAQELRRAGKIAVWLPLTFPPVPKKGSWDIKRLRDSQYFFS